MSIPPDSTKTAASNQRSAYARLSQRLAAFFAAIISVNAQTLQQPEERVALKEFVVTEIADATGYAATSTSTATRTNTALIDTPTIVNVLTRAFIEDTQASELYDALKYVPGITITSNVGDGVMMRGYGVRDQFTDGIFDNQNQSQLGAEPFQFERVEVLKGPNALVYGSTALGGLINRVRKQPKFKPEGQIGLTVGNYGQHKIELDYTAPINDKLAYRVVGVYKNEDLVNGNNVDFAYARRWNLNPTLLWRPSDTTQVKVIGEFMTERYLKHLGENFMFSNGAYDPNSSALGTFLSYPTGTVIQDGVPFEQGGITTFGLLSRTLTMSEADAFCENRKQAGLLTLETQITPEWSLRILGSAQWWDHMAIDYIPAGMERNNRYQTRVWRPIANDDFTAVFAMDSVYNFTLLGSQHKLLSIMQTQYQSLYYPIWGLQPGESAPSIDVFNPVHTGAYVPISPLRYTQNRYTTTYKFGFAVQDHARFMDDKIQLVAGARWDWFADQQKNLLLVGNAQNGPRNASQEWSYKYGAVFKPIRSFSVFINHSETFNPNFGAQPDGTTFDHQQGMIDEIGVKSALYDGRLAGSLSVYKLRLENLVQNDNDPVRMAQGWKVLSAYQEVEGFEVELLATVTPNWQVNLGLSILDMQIPPVTVGQGALHGNKLRPRGLPFETFNGWTRYDFRRGLLKGFALGGGVTYKGKTTVDDNLYYLPSVTTGDAFIQYAWGRYYLALNVSNITDKWYVSRTVGPSNMFAGPRRLIKLRVSRDI